jgi:putative phosphoesterase
MSGKGILIGLISDTHNLVRPEARIALSGVDRIIHAGDICGPAVLEQLAQIAPVTAVRGNNDHGAWAAELDTVEQIEVEGVRILVLHDLNDLTEDMQAGADVIVSGHSHKPLIRMESGVLFINPGSAGPRRFKLPVSVGFLDIVDGRRKARLQTLEID